MLDVRVTTPVFLAYQSEVESQKKRLGKLQDKKLSFKHAYLKGLLRTQEEKSTGAAWMERPMVMA